MANFGRRSREELNTCHPDLIVIAEYVIDFFDFSVIEGHRSLALQLKYYKEGRSKIDGVTRLGNHNYEPSLAYDIYPYPIPDLTKFTDKDKARFYQMSGYFLMAAQILYKQGKITHLIRLGLDWDRDGDFKDQSFDDLPHVELYKPK